MALSRLGHEVAAAVILRGGGDPPGGKLLLAHRHPQRSWYPDCWDLVGGHLEDGETAEDAIRRECREEVGISIRDVQALRVEAADLDIKMHAFVVTRWDGVPRNASPNEHDALGWFTVAELTDLKLADATYLTWLPALIDAV